MKGTLLFVHSSQVYMEELNDDSSSIRHGSTTEPSGTEPSISVIHHASLLLSPLILLSVSFCRIYQVLLGRGGLLCARPLLSTLHKNKLKCCKGVKRTISADGKRMRMCGECGCVLYMMEGRDRGQGKRQPSSCRPNSFLTQCFCSD